MSTRRQGFTLLEVLVAVTILAVGLSALFTSEAGAIRIAQRARTTTIATLLARCKMGEIEEKLGKEGWPGTDIDGRDECCEDAERDGFGCEWKVERIVLPELDTGQGEGQSPIDKLKGGAAGAAGGANGAGATSPTTPAGAAPGSPPDPGAALGIPLGGLGAGSGPGGILGSIMTSSGGGGSDPLASLAMEFTFPIMKPVIEEQVRRVTVTVSWKEGSSPQTFDIVQYLVNERPMVAPSNDDDDSLPGAPGTPGTPGTTTGAQPTTSGAGTNTTSSSPKPGGG